jgi:hypothetical protein
MVRRLRCREVTSGWYKECIFDDFTDRSGNMQNAYEAAMVMACITSLADPSWRAVYGSSLVGIAGSNPTGGMDVSVSWEFCVFS